MRFIKTFLVESISAAWHNHDPIELALYWPGDPYDPFSDVEKSKVVFTPDEAVRHGLTLDLNTRGKFLEVTFDAALYVPPHNDEVPFDSETYQDVVNAWLASIYKKEAIEYVRGGAGLRERKTRYVVHVVMSMNGEWGIRIAQYPEYTFFFEVTEAEYEALITGLLLPPIPRGSRGWIQERRWIFRIAGMKLLERAQEREETTVE